MIVATENNNELDGKTQCLPCKCGVVERGCSRYSGTKVKVIQEKWSDCDSQGVKSGLPKEKWHTHGDVHAPQTSALQPTVIRVWSLLCLTWTTQCAIDATASQPHMRKSYGHCHKCMLLPIRFRKESFQAAAATRTYSIVVPVERPVAIT